jgi:hypothetical protein
VDVGPPLAVDGEVVTRAAAGGEPVVGGSYVALFRPGDVTEILLTGGHVENSWRVDAVDPVAIAVLGQRVMEVGYFGVLTTDSEGRETEVSDHYVLDVSPSPDADAAVLLAVAPDQDRYYYVEPDVDLEIESDCAPGLVSWLPGADFAENLGDAEEPTPVTLDEEQVLVDCRTREPYEFPSDVQIDEYLVGDTRARIVWTQDDGEGAETRRVMTWTPGDDDSREIRELPVPPEAGGPADVRYGLDDGGDRLTTIIDGTSLVQVWEWRNGRWRRGPSFQSGVGGEAARAAFSQDGSLIVVSGLTGGFELLDAASGRRLVAAQVGILDDGPEVDRLQVSEANGVLYAHIGAGLDRQRVQIPVGFDRLKQLLCVLHRAPACSRS